MEDFKNNQFEQSELNGSISQQQSESQETVSAGQMKPDINLNFQNTPTNTLQMPEPKKKFSLKISLKTVFVIVVILFAFSDGALGYFLVEKNKDYKEQKSIASQRENLYQEQKAIVDNKTNCPVCEKCPEPVITPTPTTTTPTTSTKKSTTTKNTTQEEVLTPPAPPSD